MPRPVYIVCCQGSSEDKETGLMTYFQVLEKAQISPIPQPKAGEPIIVRWHPIRVVAVWMREENDNWDDQYEFQFRLFQPTSGEPQMLGGDTFQFEKSTAKPLFRVTAKFDSPIGLSGPGLIRIENRIRRVNTEQWITQDFPIVVELIDAKPQEPSPAPNGQT